jgi:transposase-like protein
VERSGTTGTLFQGNLDNFKQNTIMQSKEKQTELFPKGFFKQFKSKENFQSYFNALFKQGIEEMLHAEMEEHLGYSKHEKAGYNTGNSRNGSYSKTVQTDNVGELVLNIPRDRNAEFEPQIIPKGQTISSKIEDAILGMYSRGMSASDITHQIEDIYGFGVSEMTISNITNRILSVAKEWQQRPLESVYFTVWMDGVVVKIREDGKVINKCVFIVIGLTNEGKKEVLGFWIDKNESASFWMTVLTDLKARGVEDILIACTDNLKGFTQAIKGVFPDAITQLCIVHQIRNSCKFVVWSDLKEFCKDLKKVYKAINKKTALEELMLFKQKWESKYKYAVVSWEENWDNLTGYFDFPLELRKIIYTTNTIENLNRGIRKYTKTKTQFSTEDAATKSIYLAIENIQKNWSGTIQNWKLIHQQFLTIFEDRCKS